MTIKIGRVELLEELQRALRIVSEAMQSVSVIYDAVFYEFLELLQLEAGEYLVDSVELLQCDLSTI